MTGLHRLCSVELQDDGTDSEEAVVTYFNVLLHCL
jgi:hypothetical protein